MLKNKEKTPLPYVLFKVAEEDANGDLLAIAQNGTYQNQIFALWHNRLIPALAVGDEFLGKFKKTTNGCYVKPVSRIGQNTSTYSPDSIFGIVERQNHQCWVAPSERGAKPYLLDENKTLKNGDLVEIEANADRRTPHAKLIKNYGPFNMNKLSEILISQKYKLPHIFDADILKECQNLPEFSTKGRANLTHLPFVTIDGDDSKDFDDAVYATRFDKGFHLAVAIADVAYYVRPHSALDREAALRGNSVYLPQTVIPMLPEILSNELCSLNPEQKRLALVCLMDIDLNGNLIDWHFERAVIKSAARLTYRQVERAIGGEFDATTKKLFTKVIQPLYEAYFALDKARKKRGALEIETTEVKIRFDKFGNVAAIEKQQSLTSNKIIEEFMIAANVAAARCLLKAKALTMFRVHDTPPEDKLKEIKPLLANLKLKLPDYKALKPQHFNHILELCKQKNYGLGIDELILRLQCQAQYSPNNIGHFGLGLKEYVHFTSPIRRYADLLIHRALINACRLSSTLEEMPSERAFAETAEHLCQTERNAAAAERDITARYISSYLQPLAGTEFEVKISGLTNAGIFVRIESLGAEGLIPMRTLPDDYYQLLDAGSCLRGVDTKLKFRLGQTINAVLAEAAPTSGGLTFHYLPDKTTVFSHLSKNKSKDKKKNKKLKDKKRKSAKK